LSCLARTQKRSYLEASSRSATALVITYKGE
jgi:hypothetical protein